MTNGLLNNIYYSNMEIKYELFLMKRRSLEIAVHPDKRVVIKAPQTSSMNIIEQRIKKRARWIKKQIAYFNQFNPKIPKRNYVGGESHLYLGRKYRLKIQQRTQNSILLKNGYFHIQAIQLNSKHIKELLDAWYQAKAFICFSEIFEQCWKIFKKKELAKPTLKLQKMKTRWGSLSKLGRLTLNTNLIQSSKECIEYVIFHELCHLVHHNHSSEFYKLLDITMPDWLNRKHKLEMSLV